MEQVSLIRPIFILHGYKFNEKKIKDDLKHQHIQFAQVKSPDELAHYPSSIVIFDADFLKIANFELWKQASAHCLTISEQHLGLDTDLLLPTNFPRQESIKLLSFACQQLLMQNKFHESNNLINAEHSRISQLNEISIALSKENHLGTLLKKILQESQNLSDCDAVSLYLINREDEDNPELVFKLTYNDTLDFKMQEQSFPLNNHSIAGYAALNNQEVVIDDAYNIPESRPYQFDSSFDEKMGYRTLSILAVPITSHAKEVIGVLQFINRKSHRDIRLTTPAVANRYVIPFDKGICHLLNALASQAAISIENAILMDSIKNLFEGFVQASVTAIEQRDPTTSGHSFRVADLTTTLATELKHCDNPDYRFLNYTDSEIREIRYASLLHDFGKVGVRENVLVKPKKLPDSRLEIIKYRFELEKERIKNRALKEELRLHHSRSPIEDIQGVHKQLKLRLDKLDNYFQSIVEANEPSILADDRFLHLQELREIPFQELSDEPGFILTDIDFLALSVKKGSLTENERQQIQSHVLHTLNFLKQIPWTRDLKNIPIIAAAHHEKLNGSGYPYGLSADDISIPSRIMTICDIFDALVARDRPYKSSLPIEKALDIIITEAGEGLLDRDLVNLFINKKIFQLTTQKNYKPSMNISEPFKPSDICKVDLGKH
jgi:HD-GYP domain-containing protein (c-di-GMP phosphodiesterase class II)